MMKIGYLSEDYASKRNIINRVSGFNYVKTHDLNSLMTRLVSSLNRRFLKPKPINIVNLSYSSPGCVSRHTDICHLFNIVSFGKKPWVSTFETVLPRYLETLSCHHGKVCGYSSLVNDVIVSKAMMALAGSACKKIIALSECNLRMQVDLLRNFPKQCHDVESKLICLHPPQELFFEDYAHKKIDLDGPIHFIFVGGAFFTKGGLEILETFCALRKVKKYDLRLTIISSMVLDDYATKKSNNDVKFAQNIIENNRDWIDYYAYLPNDKVLALMRSAHVGLLPTYADTYGYSVLELQASGCPVISTNVRALPEINNNDAGWIIDIPKNRLGEAIYTTNSERAKISSNIKNGLTAAVEEIMGNKYIIAHKASAALKRIKFNHSPEAFSESLYDIYVGALR